MPQTPADEQLRIQLVNSLIKHLRCYSPGDGAHDADVRDAVAAATRDWDITHNGNYIAAFVINEEVD